MLSSPGNTLTVTASESNGVWGVLSTSCALVGPLVFPTGDQTTPRLEARPEVPGPWEVLRAMLIWTPGGPLKLTHNINHPSIIIPSSGEREGGGISKYMIYPYSGIFSSPKEDHIFLLQTLDLGNTC